MVKMSMKYLGDLQFEVEHGPSGAKIIADAPKDNGGQGRSFSPTDLAATALGSCMAMTMTIVAKRHPEIDLSGMTVQVQKEMTPQPNRRIGRLAVEIAVPRKLAPEQQKLMENAAHTCPVHKSLHPDVKVEVQFKWG